MLNQNTLVGKSDASVLLMLSCIIAFELKVGAEFVAKELPSPRPLSPAGRIEERGIMLSNALIDSRKARASISAITIMQMVDVDLSDLRVIDDEHNRFNALITISANVRECDIYRTRLAAIAPEVLAEVIEADKILDNQIWEKERRKAADMATLLM